MATLATLVVKLITDVSEFTSGMDKASSKLTKVGDSMSKIGDKMTLGVTLPIVAAGTAAVKFASDLSETRNKTATVFGDMSSQVEAMGKTASRSMGMSENAALSYASTYGSILKNMGLTSKQTAEMAQELTQLTADYASFHNLNPGEAFEKIKAGLVGSSEPLIALGKDLRVASVQAYAAANGIGSATGEMTQSELALARYGSLLSQSGDEMGDFAKTADGLANSTRTLGGTIEDTMASFGEVLIPTVTSFLQALIPILQFFNGLPQPVKQTIVYLLLFAAAMGPVLSTGGRLISFGGTLLKLFGAGGALSGAGTTIAGLASSVAGLGSGLGGLIATAAVAAAPFVALALAIGGLILVIKLFGKEAWTTLVQLGAIIGMVVQLATWKIQGFAAAIIKAIGGALNWIVGQASNFYRAGQNLMAGLINGVASFGSALIEYIVKILSYAIDAVKNLLGIHSRSTVFYDIGKNIDLGAEGGIEAFGDRPAAAAARMASGVKSASVAVSAVRPGSGRALSIGDINIYGDLSAQQRASLEDAIEERVINKIALVIGGMA